MSENTDAQQLQKSEAKKIDKAKKQKNHPTKGMIRARYDLPFTERTQIDVPRVAAISAVVGLTAHAFGADANIPNVFASDMVPDSSHIQRIDSMPSENLPLVDSRDAKKDSRVEDTNSNFEQRNRVMLDLYFENAKSRTESWMGTTKLKGVERQDFENKINEMRKVIETNPSFEGMKKIMTKYSNEITDYAIKYNVPPEIALSICLIENGGADGLVSPAGAASAMQVMPELLSQKLSQRGITQEVFQKMGNDSQQKLMREIGVENLSDMYNLFEDWGLATWAYHGGQGNVYRALSVYFNNPYTANNLPPGGYKELEGIYQKLVKDAKAKGFNFFTLLENEKVKKEVLPSLVDETELYALKAMSANLIINEQIKPVIEQIIQKQTLPPNNWSSQKP